MQYRIVCVSKREWTEFTCFSLSAAMEYAEILARGYESVGVFNGPECIAVFGDDDTLAVTQ